MLKRLGVILIVVMAFSRTVYAEEITSVLGNDRVNAVEEAAKETGLSFKEVCEDILSGKLDFSLFGVLEKCVEIFFSEIRELMGLLKPLFVAALLSALLKSISSYFKSKAVSELGFYVCYMVMIFIALDMFKLAGEVVKESLEDIRNLSAAAMPIFYTFMAASGRMSGAYIMGPFAAAASVLITQASNTVILPLAGFGVSLEIVNNLTEKEQFGKMSLLIKKGISRGLKLVAGGFMAVLSLQGMGSGAADKLAGRTAKAAIGAVPVVGDVFGGIVETAAALTGAVKGSAVVAMIIVLAAMCIVPVIKVFSVMAIFKAAAALIEPICEKRFIKALSALGDYTALLMGTLFTAMVMFVFGALVMSVM